MIIGTACKVSNNIVYSAVFYFKCQLNKATADLDKHKTFFLQLTVYSSITMYTTVQ
jgi:hypothetical protein